MVSKARKVHRTGTRSPQRDQGFTLPLWALGIIGAVFVAVAVFAGVVLFQVVEDLVATAPFVLVPEPISPGEASGGVNPDMPSQEGEENPGANPEEIGPSPAGIRPTDRVTVLVLGVDQPCSLVDEPHRSDTMILVTVDPLGRTAGLLSIPRDLWVPIPGFGNDRINTAFHTGEIRDYPGGGAALAVETVQLNLGIHVHHFVTVNYDAFIQAIDLIGGIELDVPETINDPDYPDRCYGYDPFYLPAGHHLLDGNIALKYARTRATFGADFDRAGRQQAVIMAVLDRMLQQNFALFTRAPDLWTAFEHNVTTDMTYQEALGLAWLATEIPREDVHLAVIDHNYVIDQTLMDGAQVLVPIREKIRELRDAFFSPPVTPETEIDLAAQMRAEAAAILVLNGTWTPGLAGETAQYLESLGFTIAGLDDAQEKNQEITQIIDYGGKTATVNLLAELLQVSAGSIFGGTNPDGEYDIELILGTDCQVPGN
ncbi:MAG: hypothetical protein GQ526_06950 [Ardenticatenales bacterium]|nr:hypothetical protein [Ardenticatenales bacterium]